MSCSSSSLRSGDEVTLAALLHRGAGADACTSAAVVQLGTIAGLVGAVTPADLDSFIGHLLELAAMPQDAWGPRVDRIAAPRGEG